ncbi:MAG: carboxypeptidase regulatory-like domain-containing protein [Nitrosopumilus sp.]|nr:carboxypeptidase regulatory-like domain-containing protein [Nitrosopumilus sp.]
MIKNIVILYLFLIILFPFMYVNALPENAELVLENIQIEPPYPKKGELTRITGEIYNAGTTETKSLASIITVAYFVDEKLLFIGEIDNVKPGIENKIKISSDPIWNAETGNHVIKIILDYHDTLNDQQDSFDNNLVEKTFSILSRHSTKMLLNSSPSYVIQNNNTLLNIVVSLEESDSNMKLDKKQIFLSFDGKDILPLTTDKDRTISFSKTVNSLKSFDIESIFEGDDQYRPSYSSLTIYSIPKEVTSAMLIDTIDIKKQYGFENSSFEFFVFQDSYENLIGNKSQNSTQLDSDVFLIPLPPNHDYFAEVYIDGRFASVTDKKNLKENSMIIEELDVRESAEIRFRVTDETGEPQGNVIVNNWIYSATTDEDGFTDWIKVLPTVIANEPYVAKATFSDSRVVWSDSFFIDSGEKRVIEITQKRDEK